MHIYKWLQNLLYFSKHYGTILIVTKYYTNLNNNKEGNERLNKNTNNCVYFFKNLYYDVNFAATNLVLLGQTCISLSLNCENANIHTNPLRIFQCKFCTCLVITYNAFFVLALVWCFHVLLIVCFSTMKPFPVFTQTPQLTKL